MISVPGAIIQAYDQSTTQVDRIIVDGVVHRIKNVEYYDDCYSNGNIFGTAIAKCLEFEIEGNVDLEKKEFEYQTGVIINGKYNWISIGNFITVDFDFNDLKGISKVYAQDYMLKANIPYKSQLDYSSGKITIRDVFKEACELAGIVPASIIFDNSDFIVDSNQFEDSATIINVFQAVAGISGTVAKTKSDNTLHLLNPNKITNISKVIRKCDYSDDEIKRNTHPINVVTLAMKDIEGENITLRDEESIQKLGEENAITIYNNPFAYTQDKREQLIPALFNAIKGFQYKSFSFKYQGLPYLETMDKIQFIDKSGSKYDSYVFRFNFKSPKGLESTLEAPSIIKSAVEYQVLPSAIDIARKTEYRVDKDEQIISELVTKTTENTTNIAEHQVSIDAISSTIKLMGGNNKQRNSIGAYGTKDFEQSENGTIIASEEELLKSKTDNGFGRMIYASNKKWFKFKSESLVIGDTYTLSFKYTNVEHNRCIIKLINNLETTIVDTLEDKELENIEYTFIANSEFIELYVESGEYTLGITDYYLQTGDVANKWQPASGEALSTVLSIYYNGIQVTSENSEIVTNMSNLGFSVINLNGKILITFNKDRCILSDTEFRGKIIQKIDENAKESWVTQIQKIKSVEHRMVVKINGL